MKKSFRWQSLYLTVCRADGSARYCKKYIYIFFIIIGSIISVKYLWKTEKYTDPPINVVNADEITMVNLKKQFDTTQCLSFIPEQDKYDFAKCGLDDDTQKWQLSGTGIFKNHKTKAYINKTKNNELEYTNNASNVGKFIINKDNLVMNDNNYLCSTQIIQNDCKDKVIKVDIPIMK
jgi:hypothetical protein